jgi:hypothetical protein
VKTTGEYVEQWRENLKDLHQHDEEDEKRMKKRRKLVKENEGILSEVENYIKGWALQMEKITR